MKLDHALIMLLDGVDGGPTLPCTECSKEQLDGIADEGARLFWAGVGLFVGASAGYLYARGGRTITGPRGLKKGLGNSDAGEPDEEDWTTEDHRTFYSSGKKVLTVHADLDEDAMWDAIHAKMDDDGFYPNVWFVSDHGNAHIISRRLSHKKKPSKSKKKGLGDYSADEHTDAAHVAAEDGDCARVKKHLVAAEKAGANVGRLRKQLLTSCASGDLDGTSMTSGVLPDFEEFEESFDERMDGGTFPMTLGHSDSRAADGTSIGDGEYSAKQLYKGLQELIAKDDEDASGLASSILSTLDFEWV